MRLCLLASAVLVPLAPRAQDATWVPLDDPVPTFLVDGDHRLSYAPDGEGPGVLFSSDGGATWEVATDGLPADEAAAPVYLRGEVAFARTPSGRLFRSADGGRTWADDTDGIVSRRPDDGGTGRWLNDLVRVGDAYLAVTPFGVFRRSDAGPWEPASDGLPPYTDTGVDFIAIGAASVGEVVVLASTLGLYRSDDGGATWALSSAGFEVSGVPLEAWAVHAERGRFYALADYPNPFGGVYRSDDGGRTWARKSEGLVMLLRDGGIPGPQNPGGVSQVRAITSVGGVLFLGTVGGAGVYRSADGERWEPFNDGLPLDSEGGYSAPYLWSEADAGPAAPLFVLSGLFPPHVSLRVDGAVSTAASPLVPGPSGMGPFQLGPARPNPVPIGSGAVSVEVRLAEPAAVTVEVYDALGRRVAQVEFAGLPVGVSRLDLRVPDVPAGVYALVGTACVGAAARTSTTQVTFVR